MIRIFRHAFWIALALYAYQPAVVRSNISQYTDFNYPNNQTCNISVDTIGKEADLSDFCKEVFLFFMDYGGGPEESCLSQICTNKDDEYYSISKGGALQTALLPIYFPEGAMTWNSSTSELIAGKYSERFPVMHTLSSELEKSKLTTHAIEYLQDFCSDSDYLSKGTMLLNSIDVFKPISGILRDSCKPTSVLSVLTMRSMLKLYNPE